MRPSFSFPALALAAACLAAAPAHAQKHSFGMAPPTASPRSLGPVAPISSGMGPIQFAQVNFGVPPPQALTRQLRAEDERTRASALSAIGAPGQYLQRGHIVMPHSLQLEMVPLGDNDQQDALLTAELDQHIVTAVMIEEDGAWRRIATVSYATSFDDPHTTPASFMRTAHSYLQRDRFRAVFRAGSLGTNGSYVENEADLRVLNGKAVITMSFADAARECGTPPARAKEPGMCTVTRRWLQLDTTDPNKRLMLVSATGKESIHDALGPLGDSREYELTHMRNFSCQPYVFSDNVEHFEPTAPSTNCPAK